MGIHNLMEELVIGKVEDIFADPEFIAKNGCNNSDECKTDVVCYVLNRVPPIYTTSSRGLSHISKSYIDQPQSTADIAALINEGIRQVGSHRRLEEGSSPESAPNPPLFNFPIIKGSVFDGKTFAPYAGADISLKLDGNLVAMNGPRWNNPSRLIKETEGGFLFWPLPVGAGAIDEQREFSLSIELNADGYKPVKHFINLNLEADNEYIQSTEVTRIYKVDPIYLFRVDEPEEIMS